MWRRARCCSKLIARVVWNWVLTATPFSVRPPIREMELSQSLLTLLLDLIEFTGPEWRIGFNKDMRSYTSEIANKECFRVLGYQLRVLRFNDDTRQSAAKIMAAYRKSDPGSIFLMQQAHCLAVPYVKSMLSIGLATIASSRYDLMGAVHGKKPMNILCIGHGGGCLPLFLASKIQGAKVHIVEIDPLVISASIQGMGFPAFSLTTPSGARATSKPDFLDQLLWKGIQERLYLFESDAKDFILSNSTKELYDIVFIDAYDGDDIFPRKLWDQQSPISEGLAVGSTRSTGQ